MAERLLDRYDAVLSDLDGVVYAGLQDNGEIRIEPGGYQVMAYGGDGIFTEHATGTSDLAWIAYLVAEK